jgi:hypothetical protein
VNVSVLLYVPARSASLAFTSWLKSSDSASFEIGPIGVFAGHVEADQSIELERRQQLLGKP